MFPEKFEHGMDGNSAMSQGSKNLCNWILKLLFFIWLENIFVPIASNGTFHMFLDCSQAFRASQESRKNFLITQEWNP